MAIVAVPAALVKVKLLAPSDSPEDISWAVHDVYGSATEKSAAAPAEFAMSASLDPVESLTTVAVTPRLAPVGETYELIALARSFSVSPGFLALVVALIPVAKDTGLPPTGVIVMEEVGRVTVGEVSRLEYHDPAAARLLTTTVWSPRAVPSAAVAVTSFALDDATVRADKGPDRAFSDCISV